MIQRLRSFAPHFIRFTQPRPIPVLMWGISLTFVCFQFILQLSSGLLIQPMMSTFNTTALGASIVSSSYYYVYVSLQTPAGLLIDRFGPRRVLSIGAVVCSLGCFGLAISQDLWQAEIGRIMMGAGSAFAFVASLEIAATWFSIERFGLMIGIADSMGSLASAAGNIGFAYLVAQYGWRYGMKFAACLALIIALACAWFIIDNQPDNDDHGRQFWASLKAVLSNRIVWVSGLYSGLTFSLVTVFAAVWGIPFVSKALSITIAQATMICSSMFIGVAVGSPIMGWLYPRIRNIRMALGIIAMVLALMVEGLIEFPHHYVATEGFVMFVMGILCSSYVWNYALVKDYVSPRQRGTAMGMTNTLTTFTAPILQPFIGWGLNHASVLHHGHIEQVYQLSDYQWSLRVMPLVLLFGGVITWLLPKSR